MFIIILKFKDIFNKPNMKNQYLIDKNQIIKEYNDKH